MCGKEIAAGQRGVLLKIKGISKDWETGLFLRLQNPGTGEYYRRIRLREKSGAGVR